MLYYKKKKFSGVSESSRLHLAVSRLLIAFSMSWFQKGVYFSLHPLGIHSKDAFSKAVVTLEFNVSAEVSSISSHLMPGQ